MPHEHDLARHASLAEQLVRLSCLGKRKSLRDDWLDPLLLKEVKQGDQILSKQCWPQPFGEAQAAESRKDFVHKLKICHKELRESRRWLRLIQRVPLLRARMVQPLVDETDELVRIFAASLRTAQQRSKPNR